MIGVGFELLGLCDGTFDNVVGGLLLVFKIVNPLFVCRAVADRRDGNAVGLFEIRFKLVDALLEVVGGSD